MIGAAIIAVSASIIALLRKEPKATATFILSLPCGLVLLWLGITFIQAKQHAKKSQSYQQEYEDASARLRINPEFESTDWDNVGSATRKALKDALRSGTETFTEDDLRFLYDEFHSYDTDVHYHPAFPRELLIANFPKAYERCNSGISYYLLGAICSNPNTPRELLEKVASSKTLPMGAVNPARLTLKGLDEAVEDEKNSPR